MTEGKQALASEWQRQAEVCGRVRECPRTFGGYATVSQWKRKGARDTRAEQAQTVRQELWLLIQEYGEERLRAVVFRSNIPLNSSAQAAVVALEKRFGARVSICFQQLTEALRINHRACTVRAV